MQRNARAQSRLPARYEIQAVLLGACLLLAVVALSEPWHGLLRGPTPAVANSSSHPRMYLDDRDIMALHARIRAGEQPWRAAYDKLVAAAGRAMAMPGASVVRQGPVPPGYSAHAYYTEQPYCGWERATSNGPDCRDGQVNPRQDREDFVALRDMSAAVRDLALAYQLTGGTHYARKAVELIRIWCVDPQTRMEPGFSNIQSWFELPFVTPQLLYGADLLYHYPGWNQHEQRTFLGWVRQLATSAGARTFDNNFENWRINLVAAAGVLLEDDTLLADAFDRYRDVMVVQMSSSGQLLEELDRATSLTYSLSVLAAMLQVAEIARHNGEDLYGYQDADGRSLLRALDYHVAYVLRPDTWRYPQQRRFYGEYSGLFELAYAHWPQSAFATVIRRRGRPLDLEVLGPVTLTHGRSLELRSDARRPGHPAARAGRSAARAPRSMRWE